MSHSNRPLPTLLPKSSGSSHVSTRVQRNPGDPRPPQGTVLPRKRPAVRNACNNCQRRKTKCDGLRPRCSPCADRSLNCEFFLAPGETPRRFDQQRVRNFQSVLELLRSGSDAESAEALRRIRQGDNVETAVAIVAEARLLLAATSSTAELSSSGHGALEGGVLSSFSSSESRSRRLKSPFDDPDFVFERQYMTHAKDQYVDRDVFVDVSSRTLPLSRWTTVSTDDAHMSHLVNMAFTWDNATEHLFFRPMLEEDVAALDPELADDDPGSFCSRFLVNALLALSCILTLDPVTFKVAGDSKSRGRRWADAAELFLQQENHPPSISLLQGMYALFIYEGNIGEGTKSVEYFWRAMDIYRALNDEGLLRRPRVVEESRGQRERLAMSWCMWGFYCLEWRSTEAFGSRKMTRKPKFDKVWREPDFPLRRPDCIGYWWCPYPISLQNQPSMQVEIREADVTLSELAEEILDFLHPQEGGESPLTSPTRALQLYDALSSWKLHCPSRLKFENTVLPSAILPHVYVEMLFMAILRPFADMTQAFGRFNPRDRCVAHASHLMSTIWTFRAFGQIRFEYYLTHPLGSVAYIMLQGCEDEPIHMDTLARVCQCLHEMRAMLPLATDVMSGIRAAFTRYGLPLPEYMRRYFGALRHRPDGLMHYTVAGLLPSSDKDRKVAGRAEIQLQVLLDEFGNNDVH